MPLPSLLQIETATLSSWPAITTAMDGMWLARLARGYTRRSNSICCLDPNDDGDAVARLRRLADVYLLNSRDPIFRVTPLAGPGVLAALDSEGWEMLDASHVLAMPLGRELPEPAGLKTTDATDANWLDAVRDLAGLDRRSRDTLGLIVSLIAWPQTGIVLRDAEGEAVAAALAVNAGGIGVCHNVVVHPARRGRGLGRQLMHAALNWMRESGATASAIQVAAANSIAIRLYTSLGYAHAYDYAYREPR